MRKEMIDYIRSQKPQHDVRGMDLVKEGMDIGRGIAPRKSLFCEKYGYNNFLEYRKECTEKGKINWILVVGRANLEEQIQAIKDIYEFGEKTGLRLDMFQTIPSPVNALPREYRSGATKTTSYVIDSFKDWEAHVTAAPIEILFCDFVLSSPNALESTINAVKCGSSRIGEFSQFIWKHPNFRDEYKRLCDMVKSLGIVASKLDEKMMVETYLDDGIPSYFMDSVSYVAYAMLEHYICTNLCGARYSVSFGGLLSSIDTRIGVAVALHKLLASDDQPILSYINNSTNIHWDTNIHANYGICSHECLIAILTERHYKMCMAINPIAITEKIAVPTVEEQLNVFAVGKRMEEKAHEWEKYMDWTKMDELSDNIAKQAKIMFNNIMDGFSQAGIDIEDPLELLMLLQNLNESKFEIMFHPTTYNDDTPLQAFVPTALGMQTIRMRDDIIEDLVARGYKGKLEAREVLIASGDCHSYGLNLVDGVLSEMGARVVNGGVDISPIDLLDLADEVGINTVGVSVHNGQALDYAMQLLQLAKKRKKNYCFFMGGKMNAILPGHSVPTEVDNMVRDMGILATNDLAETIDMIAKY